MVHCAGILDAKHILRVQRIQPSSIRVIFLQYWPKCLLQKGQTSHEGHQTVTEKKCCLETCC